MNADTVAPERVPTKPLREAKKRLLESALTLFAEKGYEATSIREIIEGAGVTRPVLYYYFDSKEELFKRLVQSQFNEVTQYIDATIEATSGCRDRLQALIRNTFEHTERSPRATALILQLCFSPSQHGPQIDKDRFVLGRFGRITRIMRDGLESGELAGGSAETLAVAFSGIMDMHLMAKTYQSHGTLTPELGDELVDLFLQGAASPAWAHAASSSPFAFPGSAPERPS